MPDIEMLKRGLRCIAGIDREDLCHGCRYGQINEECDVSIAKDVLDLLKEQEAVEPKTGHWIWIQFCANEGVYCSECHTKMFDRYPMKKKLSQFCGHCGAKMDDEAEGR